LVSFVDALWRTKKPRPLGLAHCLRPSQNSWLSNGKYPSLGASLLRSGDQCKSALAPGTLREENDQRPHAKRVHQGGLVNSRAVVVNVVQVAPSAQGAFAADLVGAPQAHVGPSEPKTLMVALMAQVAAAQNSMMKDPLQESSHDVDHQCPPLQLQALDVEQDTQVELAELIG